MSRTKQTIAALMPFDFEKMKALRLKLGLNQEQAAARAGFTSRQAWHNVESGNREPTISTLEKIAAALGVKAKDLLK